ncbi:MAG TPA: SURF1 family protein [Burkholderiales bacterium]|nr:SURF1 family protein [Burkholderiales bacterium]
MRFRLRFRWSLWPALAAAAGIALTAWLGTWQYGRGQEKSALAARIERLAQEPPITVTARELDARDVALRRVEARGTFEPQYVVFLDNRVRRGIVGYHVVMPLKLDGGARYLLVNRGWIAAGPDRARLPEVRTPQGPILVRGRAVLPGRFLELSDEVTHGPVWQNLALERYRSAMPIAIQPFVVQQDPGGAPDDGLIREWSPPDLGVDKHYGYAFQWFALSLLILVFYLATHVRRDRES